MEAAAAMIILPTSELTTLSSVPEEIRGGNGAHSRGTWKNGEKGSPLVIKVPVDATFRQLLGIILHAKDFWEPEDES